MVENFFLKVGRDWLNVETVSLVSRLYRRMLVEDGMESRIMTAGRPYLYMTGLAIAYH